MLIQLTDFEKFEDRELDLLRNCINYAKDAPQGGLPGHNLLLLVAKLHNMLVQPTDRYISRAMLEKIDNFSQEWDGDLDKLQLDLKTLINFLER